MLTTIHADAYTQYYSSPVATALVKIGTNRLYAHKNKIHIIDITGQIQHTCTLNVPFVTFAHTGKKYVAEADKCLAILHQPHSRTSTDAQLLVKQKYYINYHNGILSKYSVHGLGILQFENQVLNLAAPEMDMQMYNQSVNQSVSTEANDEFSYKHYTDFKPPVLLISSVSGDEAYIYVGVANNYAIYLLLQYDQYGNVASYYKYVVSAGKPEDLYIAPNAIIHNGTKRYQSIDDIPIGTTEQIYIETYNFLELKL